MLKCGIGSGEISPGTYTVKLQALADADQGTVSLTFGPGSEEYDLYAEVLR